MSKYHSCPPVLILMDVLFIFLFSSLLEKPPKLDVIPPANVPFVGGEIIALDAAGATHSWYDNQAQAWRSVSELVKKYQGKARALTLDCESDCMAQIPNAPVAGELKIVVIGELFTQISELTLLACNTNAVQCGNITFTITPQGQVDMEKLLNDNPVFQEIPGVEYLAKSGSVEP